MIINNEPYLIEYNVRMGDPECQTILPKLETDFATIIDACVNQKWILVDIEWSNEKKVFVLYCVQRDIQMIIRKIQK